MLGPGRATAAAKGRIIVDKTAPNFRYVDNNLSVNKSPIEQPRLKS
jgi:hypothetical protein